MIALESHYEPALVTVSVLIATLASFVSLDLAKRVRSADRRVALAWGVCGSIAMGSGIWAMHFVGMMAFSLPIELGYGATLTALSWVAAVAVSGVALAVASRRRVTPARIALGSALMGGGICAMHYIGMAALDLAPGIVWNGALVAASALIAVVASAAALTIFRLLRSVSERQGLAWQGAAALAMGLAISGMHYTGMAAASFSQGTVCRSAGALGGSSLSAIVIGASVLMLGLTLVTSILDGRLRDRTTRLAASLSQANAELETLAFRDALTGLPNRLLFENRLLAAAGRLERAGAGGRLALFFVDLDGFKPVNDSLGHTQGDEVLREVAARLRGLAREGDTVARIGGDEYVLMVEASGPPEQCRAQAQRLVAELARPLRIADLEFVVSASVGVSVHPDHGAADKLLAHADAAMYAAKRAGGGRCVLYHPGMDESAFDQLSLQTELRQAIEQGALELHYQPKIDARSGATVGVEALLRWHHPERGPVSPAVFVPVAERFGLIGALGDWVIDEACRQMGVWAEAGMAVSVAINLSVHQLRREGLAAYIDAALRRRRVAPSQLLCEITESVAMDDLGASLPVFEQLLAIGVYLSIDDFGTGYSSLSYLRRLPARQLKIDRSFVHDLEASADARAIVQAVLGVAHALGLSVVAEGVETAGQCKILRALGCDELQGYLFARPMPAAELPDWLALRSGQRFADEIEPVLAEEQRVADEAARSAENAA